VLDSYVESLNAVVDYYEISTSSQRLAAFLAQVSHESGGFNYIKENLNYSAEGLKRVFVYFTNDEIAFMQKTCKR